MTANNFIPYETETEKEKEKKKKKASYLFFRGNRSETALILTMISLGTFRGTLMKKIVNKFSL